MIVAANAPLRSSRRRRPALARWAFALGVLAVTGGVLLQVPDVLRMARDMRAMSNKTGGMAMSMPVMTIGMLLAGAGLAAAAWSVFQGAPRSQPGLEPMVHESIQHQHFRPIYAITCTVLTIALVIDVMKPLTIGFVLPGMRREYGLSLGAVSLLPIVALTGTVIGSILWGLLGDRYGRRPVLLLATLIFIATSACGAMPAFGWNLLMCFLMGASAGGLLPVVFTLTAEFTPRSQRGWIAVSIGSVGGLGGYLAASNASRLLEPSYTWRGLWLIGLPTGLALLALSPWVPESPNFLVRAGRRAEAEALLRRYGSRFGPAEEKAASFTQRGIYADLAGLLRSYPMVTSLIAVIGVIWGVVNFGFMVLLPAELRSAGMADGSASSLLANSALYSAPALIVVVLLYATWNARSALAFFIGLMAVALSGLAYWTTAHRGAGFATLCIAVLVISLTAVNAMLLPYSAEIYPTAVRATGTGLAAGATKLGGVLGPSLMLLIFHLGGGGLQLPAVVLAVGCAFGVGLLLKWGPQILTTSSVTMPQPVGTPAAEDTPEPSSNAYTPG